MRYSTNILCNTPLVYSIIHYLCTLWDTTYALCDTLPIYNVILYLYDMCHSTCIPCNMLPIYSVILYLYTMWYSTCILCEMLSVRAVCSTTTGSRGMLLCVKIKHRRYGPTRRFKSVQFLIGWTASYSEICSQWKKHSAKWSADVD